MEVVYVMNKALLFHYEFAYRIVRKTDGGIENVGAWSERTIAREATSRTCNLGLLAATAPQTCTLVRLRQQFVDGVGDLLMPIGWVAHKNPGNPGFGVEDHGVGKCLNAKLICHG